MTGPNPKMILITIALINIPSIYFFSSPLPYLTTECSVNFLMMALPLYFSVNYLLYKISVGDPGFIPKSKEIEEYESKNGELRNILKKKIIMINGKCLGQLKFCHTCKIIRPPQTVHCKHCNACLRRMDHHCNWIGSCIGIRNYRYFFLFCGILLIYCVFVFFSCLIYYANLAEDVAGNQQLNHKHLFEAMKYSPFILVLLVFDFLATYFAGLLCYYHFTLRYTNNTTYDDIKKTYYGYKRTPFDNFGILKNLDWIISLKKKSLMNFTKPIVIKEQKQSNVQKERSLDDMIMDFQQFDQLNETNKNNKKYLTFSFKYNTPNQKQDIVDINNQINDSQAINEDQVQVSVGESNHLTSFSIQEYNTMRCGNILQDKSNLNIISSSDASQIILQSEKKLLNKSGNNISTQNVNNNKKRRKKKVKFSKDENSRHASNASSVQQFLKDDDNREKKLRRIL